MGKSTRIIDLETRILPNGGASVSCRMNFQAPTESAKTAVAKAILFLNDFCDRQKLGFFLVPFDAETNQRLKITIAEAKDAH